MGKAKKIKVSKCDTRPKIGLAEQIEDAKSVKSKDRRKVRIRKDEDEEVRRYTYKFIIIEPVGWRLP